MEILCNSTWRSLLSPVEACILSLRGFHRSAELLAFPRAPFHLSNIHAYTEPVSFGNREIIFMISDSSSPMTDKNVSMCIQADHFTATHQLYHCSSPRSTGQSVLYRKGQSNGALTTGGLNLLGFSPSFLMASPASFAPSISRPAL